MHPYSERFIARQGLIGGELYLVPAGRRAIVSNLTCYWNGTVGFGVRLTGSAGQTVVFFGGTVADGPPLWYWWDGHMVYYAGETIGVYTAVEAADVTVSGYLLTE